MSDEHDDETTPDDDAVDGAAPDDATEPDGADADASPDEADAADDPSEDAAEADDADDEDDADEDDADEDDEAEEVVATTTRRGPPPRPGKDAAARKGPARPKGDRKAKAASGPKGSRKARRRRFGAPEGAVALTLLLVVAQVVNLVVSETKASTGAWALLAVLVGAFLWACANLAERRGRLAKYRNRGLGALALVLALAAFSLVTVSVNQATPQLGIDLRGGFSVTLTAEGDPPSDSIDQAVEIIRNRIDGLGVAEPEVTRQGDAVVVNLPGVQDRDRALEIVGTTAKLEFRPVLVATAAAYDAEAAAAGDDPCAAPEVPEDTTSTTAATDDTTSTTVAEDPTATTAAADASSTTVGDDTTTTEAPAATEEEGATPPPASPATPVDGEVAAGPLARQEDTSTTVAPEDTTSTTTATDDTTSTTVAPDDTTSTTLADDGTAAPAGPSDTETIPNRPDATTEPVFCSTVGPVGFEGSALSKAQAELSGQTGSEWVVSVAVKGSQRATANTLINACYSADATCPTQQMAIVLDGEVISAPTVQNLNLADDDFVISGGGTGGFKEGEAKDLALKLRYGALPVEFRSSDEQQLSPSLGDDTLRAGILAGVIGLVAVALYLIAYYRALGIVVVLGLAVWSALMYGVVCWLSATQGLTLSISGVVGIVVSLGTTVDSYVVHFERLKDEVRLGKSVRASAEKGFQKAFRTILTADLASLMGAVLLWWLTVGAVRGFAFFLGLSVVLDLFVAYCFDRPMVALLARSDFFVRHPVFGVARGLGRSSDDAPGRPKAGASA